VKQGPFLKKTGFSIIGVAERGHLMDWGEEVIQESKIQGPEFVLLNECQQKKLYLIRRRRKGGDRTKGESNNPYKQRSGPQRKKKKKETQKKTTTPRLRLFRGKLPGPLGNTGIKVGKRNDMQTSPKFKRGRRISR